MAHSGDQLAEPLFFGLNLKDMIKYLNVAVGIIHNAQQEIFIFRCAADVHMANFLGVSRLEN